MRAIESDARDKFDQVMAQIWIEYLHAINKWPSFRSRHEGYALVHEELDELWEVIKLHKSDYDGDINREALQVATMAIRFLGGLGI